MHTRSRLGISLTLAVGLALIAVPAAQALYVKGQQTPVRANTYEMTGGLIGGWKVTKIHVKQTSGVLKIKGQELFEGCVDVARDASCAGDPTGTLDFRFRYWAVFSDDDDVPELGTCAHRIVGGTGGLAGTTGFLMMVDTPIGSAPGFKTHYEGEINPPGFAREAAGAKPPMC